MDLSNARGTARRHHLVDDQLNLLAVLLFNSVNWYGLYRIVTNDKGTRISGQAEINYILAHPHEWYMEQLL